MAHLISVCQRCLLKPTVWRTMHVRQVCMKICNIHLAHLLQGFASTSPANQAPLKLGFIGAGGVNFGTPEGTWNHAVRLDKLPGQPMCTCITH